MLTLTLSPKVGGDGRTDYCVVIGDPMDPVGYLEVVEIRNKEVRIGFAFPPDVPVNRESVVHRIINDKENQDG